jgi:hypothetical protein
MAAEVLTNIPLTSLPKISQGKVRYELVLILAGRAFV